MTIWVVLAIIYLTGVACLISGGRDRVTAVTGAILMCIAPAGALLALFVDAVT